MTSFTGREMTRILPKFSFVFVLFVLSALVLSGCGRRPSINDLGEPRDKKTETTVKAAERPTLDGKTISPEPADKVKPKRSFILDALL